MSKEKSPKKSGKKKALMTAKEKRTAKRIKKAANTTTGLHLVTDKP